MQYQKTSEYFAQIGDGFEEAACKELQLLGATGIRPAYHGIYFKADPAVLYAVNYQSRLASRVLAPLLSFTCRDRRDLYRATKSINWTELFTLRNTFGIFANVANNAKLRHSKFAALCMKDAVVDQFREHFGKRPNVDRQQPDIWLNLFIDGTRGTINFDTSGGSLHRRGYRRSSVAAPMRETLAAALVALSEWDRKTPLVDPMCGSGTLMCEAVMSACRIPAGHRRKQFGFSFLPDFDESVWQSVKQKADRQIRDLPPGLISGSDIDAKAVKTAKANLRSLPGGNAVQIRQSDFRSLDSLENRIILCNPPYGLRLKDDSSLAPFYKSLGDFLKQRCKGSQAYIFFGNRELIKKIGLRPTWKKPMRNAGLDGRFVRYDLY